MIKYVIISPVKNEEKFIEKTLFSVTQQNILPLRWIIVNDGSTDATSMIIERFTQQYPWIQRIDMPDKGFRAGTGPAYAFNRGLEEVKDDDFDFIINLDGDVSFDNGYFEDIFEEFKLNPKLGIASGKSFYLENGKRILHRCADTSTMGPSKVYRRKCFEDVGGALATNICWDMIDDLKAQMKGWEVRSFRDIHFIHYKRIGVKQGNNLGTYIFEGNILYQYGYDPLFLLVKSVYSSIERPY